MIPNLPRPLLWTEIKTMKEFLNGDFLTSMLYNIFKSIQETFFIPHVNEVSFFNELYYQLTRYYYEKPDSNDYHRYYADIRSNLGMVECADLVMTMMYHYCRLRDHQFVFRMDSFMQTVQLNQYPGVYWRYFETSTSSLIRWIDIVPYPQKPCPVAPEKLIKMKLDWSKITQNYDLENIIDLLKLWEKEEDQKVVASTLMNAMPAKGSSLLRGENRENTRKYLLKVREGEENKFAPIIKLKPLKFEDEKPGSSTMSIEALKRENKILKDEISKISAERDWYMEQADKMSELLEKANKEIQDEVEEREKSNKLTRQQIEGIDMQMKTMIEKLGNTTIPLKTLVDSIKRYATLYGLEKALDLLQALNIILIRVRAWADNVEELENYFIQLLENNKQPAVKIEKAQVTMQQPTINAPLNDIHNNNNVNMGGE